MNVQLTLKVIIYNIASNIIDKNNSGGQIKILQMEDDVTSKWKYTL